MRTFGGFCIHNGVDKSVDNVILINVRATNGKIQESQAGAVESLVNGC